jgi:G3E family GTPase
MVVPPRTPITLITGSLGSGKTTLVKRIISSFEGPLAVLMNEFGEIAIDSRIIQGENVDIVELAGGCVCCTLTGEFEAAVREIISRVKPMHIVVEATGVAEADALVYEVEDNLPEVRLDTVVCLVDAYLTICYPHMGYTTRMQLEAADVLLINKVDLVSPAEVQQVEEQIRQFNQGAHVFQTVNCGVDIPSLLGVDVTRKRPVAARTEASETSFESFTYDAETPLDRRKFEQTIAELPPSVFRAKGFVRFENSQCLFNYVLGRTALEQASVDRTQLVFIGRGIEQYKKETLQRLQDCEVAHAI